MNRLDDSRPAELANGESQVHGVNFVQANDLKSRSTSAVIFIFLLLFAVRSAEGSPQQRYSWDQVPTNPPSISLEPVSTTIIAGQRATFTVVAVGNRLHYQWSRNGMPITGATSATFTTPATTASDNGAQFTVRVSNWTGSTSSDDATLTVISDSAQLTPSSSALNFGTVEIGGSRSLGVTVTNSGSASATISSVNISGSGFSAPGLSGVILSAGQSTTVNVTFAPWGSGNLLGSVVIVSDATNSPATINVSGIGVTTSTDSITVTPANQTVPPGTQLQFKATDNLGNDVTPSVIWASSDSSVVTITSTGLATGITEGIVTISASK